MSYFEDASLVYIPSAVKNAKTYSIKPTDGSGDLTFSRASNATRVNSSGLVEKVRTNLITYSQDFTNANWVGFDVSRTDGQTDPNGGTTAALYTGLSNFSAITGSFSTASSNLYTASIYIKGTSSGVVSLRVDSGGAAPQNNISYTTEWQRFTYTFTANSATSTLAIGNYASFTAGEGIYVAFAQAETGDIATDYIATTSSAVSVGPVSGLPRLDYSGGASCPSLLLEPQRTNDLTYSEQFDNAAWTKVNLSVSANTSDTVDPTGYYGADKITDDATNASHLAVQFNQWDTTEKTASLFAKAGTSSKVFIQNSSTGQGVFADLSTQTLVVSPSFTGTLTAYGNGWYRITATHTAAAAQTFGIGLFTGTSTPVYSGTGSYAYIYGAQVEEGAYATSYIPNLDTILGVTRAADAASKTGIASLIGQSEGTLFWEGIAPPSDTVIMQLEKSSPLCIARFIKSGGNITGQVYIAAIAFNFAASITPAVGTTLKLALGYKSGSLAFYANGSQIGTSSSSFAGLSLDTLRFADDFGTPSASLNENNQALLFTTRLSNSDLATLTSL